MKTIEARNAYKRLHSEIEEILFCHDLVGISSGENRDEYDPEVATILHRLKNADSQFAVEEIIFEEFVHWFGKKQFRTKMMKDMVKWQRTFGRRGKASTHRGNAPKNPNGLVRRLIYMPTSKTEAVCKPLLKYGHDAKKINQ